MTTRYQFLAMLHEVLCPAVYLDIGVQNGHSMRLSKAAHTTGVDPNPTGEAYRHLPPGWQIYPMTSDDFFAQILLSRRVDFASIDGMHLFEYALRDFIGVEQHSHAGTVVVFDDVSPYAASIATREQPPGDWTGDVWKIRKILDEHRPDLTTVLVDTFPTGTLVVWGLDPSNTVLRDRYADIERQWLAWGDPVPADILNDRGVQPHVAIEALKRRES